MNWAGSCSPSGSAGRWTSRRRTSIEIYVDGSSIVEKYEPHPACSAVNGPENITVYKGKNVCANCIKELKKA